MRDASLFANLQVVFFEGGSAGDRAKRDGDTVALPAADGYASLATKVKGFLAYCLDTYEFEHLFKCDDDTYVCLPRLMSMELDGVDYAGFDYAGRGAATGGGGYWLSRRAARVVVEQLHPEEGGWEDTQVGMALGRAGIRLRHIEGLPPRLDERNCPRTAPLPWNERITGHYSTPEQMLAVHAHWEALAAASTSGTAEIQRARWGVEDRWVDVTETIRAAAHGGALSVLQVAPSLLGDPAPGMPKSLIIDLEVTQRHQRLVIGENLSFVHITGPDEDDDDRA